MLEDFTYFDNNATTIIPSPVKDEIVKWMNHGNASALYADNFGTKKLIDDFKDKVASVCEFDRREYKIIITSGATESNNFMLRATINSYIVYKKHQPHVIISAIEHNSIMECAHTLHCQNKIELTILKPNSHGRLTWQIIKPYIQTNTCLVCVMFANNETGIINDIEDIGSHLDSKEYSIPFYVDCVQTFGKFPVRPSRNKITAFCASFHKLQGPPGIGVFVGNRAFMDGFKIGAEICGSQNNGLRGGTENIPYIAGALAAMRETFKNRERKNTELLTYQLYLLKKLQERIPTSFFNHWTEENIEQVTGIPNYRDTNKPPNVEMVVFGTESADPKQRWKSIIPNTLLISFIRHNEQIKKLSAENDNGIPIKNASIICNMKLFELLYNRGIIIGLGSACKSGKKSHVLQAMNVPDVVINGAIRISFGDNTTDSDVRALEKNLLESLHDILMAEPRKDF